MTSHPVDVTLTVAICKNTQNTSVMKVLCKIPCFRLILWGNTILCNATLDASYKAVVQYIYTAFLY